MNISPTEAEESLAAIEAVVRKTQRAISSSGAYNFLIIWGIVWLFGFLASHFFRGETVGHIWMGLDIVGGLVSIFVGARLNRNIRSPSAINTGKRIAWFWLVLFIYTFTTISVAWPVDNLKLAMFIILFVMIGWMAMGILLSFASVWWGLAFTALALVGYFFLPNFFYLLMAFLGGGGMIALGIYIRARW